MSAVAPDIVAKHAAGLLGLTVTGKVAQATSMKGAPLQCVVDDEAGALVCLIQFEFALGAAMGAALSRIPAGAVQDATKAGAMDETLLGNFHEIANVLTVLTTNAMERRTILRGVKQGKDALDPVLTAFAAKAKSKVYGQLSIQGYPGGCVAFLFA